MGGPCRFSRPSSVGHGRARTGAPLAHAQCGMASLGRQIDHRLLPHNETAGNLHHVVPAACTSRSVVRLGSMPTVTIRQVGTWRMTVVSDCACQPG